MKGWLPPDAIRLQRAVNRGNSENSDPFPLIFESARLAKKFHSFYRKLIPKTFTEICYRNLLPESVTGIGGQTL
jgi:hypothetical protein